jgi:hypothetical protein
MFLLLFLSDEFFILVGDYALVNLLDIDEWWVVKNVVTEARVEPVSARILIFLKFLEVQVHGFLFLLVMVLCIHVNGPSSWNLWFLKPTVEVRLDLSEFLFKPHDVESVDLLFILRVNWNDLLSRSFLVSLVLSSFIQGQLGICDHIFDSF